MKLFTHINAKTVEEASHILKEHGSRAKIIAGGSDLLGTLKDQIHPDYPEIVLNIKTLDGLEYIKEENGTLKIGALTKLKDLENDPILSEKYPMLTNAAHQIASPQIRNEATVGGNICQEPRCWYYRYPNNTFHCLRKGGDRCNALIGENRYHSIFGSVRMDKTACSMACPAGTNIPVYLKELREDSLFRAAEVLLEANPIPAITGRVCPHFCEQDCNRNEFDGAVSVRGIERYLGDFILENADEIMKLSVTETGKKVAIVGSGPAGLSAAYYLRNLGYGVTVYEKNGKPGGMLTYAIPTFRLPNDIVERVVKTIKNLGVEFKFNAEIGKDIPFKKLVHEFDSLFIANGAWGMPSIRLEGEALTINSLDFLSNAKHGINDIKEKRVVVIGGGNVAVDVAVTAKRLGAEQVTMACLERSEEMPAYEWEVAQADEEGVVVMPEWGPLKIIQSDGKVKGIELVHCTAVLDDDGRFAPTFDKSVTQTIEADEVILAVGQKSDLSFIDPELKVDKGLVIVDRTSQATSISKIFAGGDVTTGSASVIEAITSGRRASIAIGNFLNGVSEKVEDNDLKVLETHLDLNCGNFTITNRAKMTELPLNMRSIAAEDVLGLDSKTMKTEANRCFNCGCVAVNPSDLGVALLALDAKIVTNKRTMRAGQLFGVKRQSSTNLDPDELIIEIQIPETNPETLQAFSKFRIRKSIDFAIGSVGVVLNLNSGRISDSRMALGAVAPIPIRVKKAEQFLNGREPGVETAEQAAEIAVRETSPLGRNKYKVHLFKALVKRTILNALESKGFNEKL
ncbi:MAG: pyridine nucleotide-disulfide oxidoreductase [Deltaproteobacteria bacterium]|nr:MAG: pyridine nucleotide-disulfide oxidoreductase [Deltaproteobacteria bacterium]